MRDIDSVHYDRSGKKTHCWTLHGAWIKVLEYDEIIGPSYRPRVYEPCPLKPTDQIEYDWHLKEIGSGVVNGGALRIPSDQVVEHPLADWSALDRYRPPDPLNPFYYERIEPLLDEAGDRYVVVTS